MHWGGGRGRGRGGRGAGDRGGGRRGGVQHSWQRKMLTKLVKDSNAVFKDRDVGPFIEGMGSFDSKPELLALLGDERFYGAKRIRDCLSMISSSSSVDDIVAPILTNIITPETGRPLYKLQRDGLINSIFTTPGLVEFLATGWVTNIDQSLPETIHSICEFLLIASMSLLEARNSDHVRTIASEIRGRTDADAQMVRRLCAVIQLDALAKEVQAEQVAVEENRTAACWGSDLHPPGGRHDNDHSNYRDVSLVPTQLELGFEGRPWLPLSNGKNSLIADAEERLLDRNFRLLREDAVGVMRDNIANPRASKVWPMARVIGASCKDAFNPRGTAPLYFLVQFDIPKGRKVDWKRLRSLPLNGLVALRKNGEPPIMASTFVRTIKENAWLSTPGGPVIGLLFHHDDDIRRALTDASVNISISKEYEAKAQLLTRFGSTDKNRRIQICEDMNRLKRAFLSYELIETSDSFFAYQPILESLKAMVSVPLAQDIVLLNSSNERPNYLPRHVQMPTDFGGFECDLDHWSNNDVVLATTLDASQARALHMALTSRVALIQGPPGTGKTFIGGLVAQMIRDNSDESILCVCYTNHALDQFLHHMLKRGETRLVRIGGRTKSEDLKRYELKTLARTKERTRMDAEHRMRVVVAKLHGCNEEMTALLETLQIPLQWSEPDGGVEELFYTLDGQLHKNFPPATSDDGFQVVGKGNKIASPQSLFEWWKNGEDCPLWLSERLLWEDDEEFRNIWGSSPEERLQLLNEFKQLHMQGVSSALQEAARRHQELSKEKDMISREIDARILKEARIIGATTTGAAKYRDLLSIKSAGVVIVEEAGEVLEPHVLSALSEATDNSEETKHLILIGDHKQLRPKVESYNLTKVSGHGYDFDVSLFERMILAGYPSSMLQVQHRMRPCISDIIRQQTYPSLEDHKSVHLFPDVKGVSENLLFINHASPEEGADDVEATTKSNIPEASYCVEVVRYLLLQGYKHSQITILTPYVGQILTILRQLRVQMSDVSAYISELDQREILEEEDGEEGASESLNSSEEDHSIRCASIDNFQGEESDIIVVSLVRSNKQGAIGFLKEEQRVNVLLSRARHGMFIVGNAATLRSSTKGRRVWQPILNKLEESGRLMHSLPTICQIHPNDGIIECKDPRDFRAHRPNGGCLRPCGARLECGHACPLTCHPTDRNHTMTHRQCVQPCRRIPPKCTRNHTCPKLCNEPCGNCNEQVENVMLSCGHELKAPTCHSVRDEKAILELSSKCKESISFTFSLCGHQAMTTCGNAQSSEPTCPAKCGHILPDCHHPCQNSCGTCENTTKGHSCKQTCQRTLLCGHTCLRKCHGSAGCGPCRQQCGVACPHSKCERKCSEVCASCVEECDWQCKHMGQCNLVCGAPCNRLPCNKRCEKTLPCGHQCPSVCGENCPNTALCVECCSDKDKQRIVEFIEFEAYKDHNLNDDPIIFLPCGHFFSMTTLDGVIELSVAYKQDREGNYTGLSKLEAAAEESKPKSCPECRTVIHSVKRYGRLLSFQSLRSLEWKHMMKVDSTLKLLSTRFEDLGTDYVQLQKLLKHVNELKTKIEQGPMQKVFQACGGKGIDVPVPPSRPILRCLRLKAGVFGKLVQKKSDKAYILSCEVYGQAIEIADKTQSKRLGGVLRLDRSSLLLKWENYSSVDSVKGQVTTDMKWIINMLKGVDEQLIIDAKKVLDDMSNQRVIKEIVKAMNIVEGYDYGGSWSDHWYQCPNGHPYFIGECGGAMEESRCIECGARVGGTRHELLGTNRAAEGTVAEALL